MAPILSKHDPNIFHPYILIYKMLVSVCVSILPSVHTDFSAVLYPFWEFEVSLKLARQGHAYYVFHTFSCTPLYNFHAISCNFGYFSHFWANFIMLGIKMSLLELRNSMVILSGTPSQNFRQFSCKFMQYRLFQPFLGQFQHVGYQ